jgi:hypothetical protein
MKQQVACCKFLLDVVIRQCFLELDGRFLLSSLVLCLFLLSKA